MCTQTALVVLLYTFVELKPAYSLDIVSIESTTFCYAY